MPTSTGEFSYRQWKEVHDFFDGGKVSIDSIEASRLDYKSVQKNTYEDTLMREEQSIKERNTGRKNQAYNENKPALNEGFKASVVAAAVEGGTTFIIDIVKKKREGKRIREFTKDDWNEIAVDTGGGFAKGGIRGSSIYLLTNFTATPAAVASAIVTASFGVANQANMLRQGRLDELAFIENSEMLCLDAAVSALSSFAGQVVIPVPVIGAVIGNAVGTMLYQISKDNLSAREQRIVEKCLEEIKNLDEELMQDYKNYIDELSKDMESFMAILDRAFAPDMRIAFRGSIELAKELGVPEDEILDSKEKIISYFMD